MDEQLRELRDIIRKKSLRIGDFTLTSGKKSSYYLDCRTTTLDPRGALLIARLILQNLQKHNIEADAIGGLTMGADPIATAVAVVSGLDGRPVGSRQNRRRRSSLRAHLRTASANKHRLKM